MPEANGEGLIARLMRENALLTQHCESWARDYHTLAAKLDAADRENADLRERLGHVERLQGEKS